MLPEVRPSSEVYGQTAAEWFGGPIPIAGDAGDQQAATFGQACFDAGQRQEHLRHRLLHADEHRRAAGALAEQPADDHRLGLGGKVTYCLEGSVFIAGAVVQWLRDGLGIIHTLGRSRAAGRQRARLRRRLLRAGAWSAWGAALGPLRPRHDPRHYPRHHGRPPGPGGRGIDGLSNPRRAGRHAEGCRHRSWRN